MVPLAVQVAKRPRPGLIPAAPSGVEVYRKVKRAIGYLETSATGVATTSLHGNCEKRQSTKRIPN